MNRQILFIVLALLIVILSVSWWPNATQETQKQSKDMPLKSDYFIKQVKVKNYDQNGLLENQLTAEKLEHFKTNQTSAVIQPKIQLRKDKSSNWSVSAASGTLDHKNNQIILRDSVVIEQSSAQVIKPSNDTASIQQTRIEAKSLNFDLNNNLASTPQNVSILSNNFTTISDSMFIDFGREEVILNGKIQTEGVIDESN